MAELAALCAWARDFLPAGVVADAAVDAVPITGDAGFRRYYRLDTRPPLIAVIAPPDRENNPAFVAKGLALGRAGVHVPAIHAVDFQRGFLLLEDLGDRLFLPLLDGDSVASLYDRAEGALARIQGVAPDPAVFPPYSEQLLRDEMQLFPDWFVTQLLGISLDGAERQLLADTFDRLLASARAQPQVVVHRDYHSRNLLAMDGGDVGVVDFQDGVVGPFSYDLVSLLKDCYIRWPAELVRRRALAFLRAAWPASGGETPADGQLLAWFDLMGLQRHIKVLGIFARLWLRDGKARYLDDLPLVMRYTLEVTQHYKDFAHFNQWFGERLMPVIVSQPWYRPWQQAGD
ncbi:MAG: phosphotransferase [Porticoccaceae bacterium]|jgi:aminoglycoside/choline kinase family phosphotransferase|nr:phosphotransferase [Porticoccaceae bacterium]HLS99795.1 phosphotransferase [Porticoccaceae bacterium]